MAVGAVCPLAAYVYEPHWYGAVPNVKLLPDAVPSVVIDALGSTSFEQTTAASFVEALAKWGGPASIGATAPGASAIGNPTGLICAPPYVHAAATPLSGISTAVIDNAGTVNVADAGVFASPVIWKANGADAVPQLTTMRSVSVLV